MKHIIVIAIFIMAFCSCVSSGHAEDDRKDAATTDSVIADTVVVDSADVWNGVPFRLEETEPSPVSKFDSTKAVALKAWSDLEARFNKAPLSKKDALLDSLFRLKLLEMYQEYLVSKFDSLLMAFLHDKRTFRLHFKSHPPKWNVAMSNDGKVKMYSYEQSGGSAEFGMTVLQFLDRNGRLTVKEIKYEEPDGGVFFPPIYNRIRRTRHGYNLYGGTEMSSQDYYEAKVFVHDKYFKDAKREIRL